MSDIFYRKAVLGDVPALCDLYLELNETQGDDTRPTETIIEENWSDIQTYVAEKDGAIIALACGARIFLPHMGFARYDIYSLHVKSLYRRQGIAKKLMHFMIKEQYDKGLRFFTLQVKNDNHSARSFYQDIGFIERSSNSYQCILGGEDLEVYINE